MSRLLKAASISAFGLLVAVALAVGAQSAFARSVTMTCTYNPPRYLGSCSTQAECDANCKLVNGQESVGHCGSDGCCQCLF
jgi:hypothetical protein